MSLLARPALASPAAKVMQRLNALLADRHVAGSLYKRYPEYPRNTHELTIPTSVAPARVVVYVPDRSSDAPAPPVHVNFHGGGFVLPPVELDDPLCRFLAAEAGVVVVNVDYVVAPQHPFPAPPHQAYEVVRWVAENGAENGWDGRLLTVGGQSAGGALAAAVARQALEKGGPSIALQILHYPPLDLATNARDKRSVIDKPLLRPWMADIFDTSYVPDVESRTDRLVSPAHPSDIADLTGIAPAFVITPEHDLLRAEGTRYAERLRGARALYDHCDVPGADHGYDQNDAETAREVYGLMAQHMRQAVFPD
ncbi:MULTISPECIES: alpha/beta hydrolase fold domain-containing protein [Streptomyces]|uniref:alpha/beta hydrolase fold domain-containing protein n=1 Tax=Streptomyces TaxID=1883 RepID=UPI000A382D78|nr:MULTISPECIES: alpha/beta hydrolase fold domain-containing protein [Streptomyces]MDX3586376.1 alpha/beta hydrolase fold domain-containing protein [Streptomyces europaeiscabiei]MDX3635621.1 alpha/beta hydrolase fold domain-containing protein [Streptomyces europaeiscabiei]MDX3653852.1 alpha/beta hydrolase fold domain-containing protein [Streptomyces europaeiscabiei]